MRNITVGPIEPNLHPYNFVVDGAGVAGPSNPDLFPKEPFKPGPVDIPTDPPKGNIAGPRRPFHEPLPNRLLGTRCDKASSNSRAQSTCDFTVAEV